MSSEDERLEINNVKRDRIKDIGLVVLGVLLTRIVYTGRPIPMSIPLFDMVVEADLEEERKAIVVELSELFDFVDSDSGYRDAIGAVYKEYISEKLRADNEERRNKELTERIIKLTDDKSVSNAVDRAKEYAEQENYTLAIDTLRDVSAQTAEIRTLIRLYEEQAASQLWDNVRAMIADGNFEDATKAIENYGYELPDGYNLDELRAELSEKRQSP